MRPETVPLSPRWEAVKRTAARVLRIAIAVALLWYSGRDVEWFEVERQIEAAQWRWIAAAIALVIVDRFLMAWRWLLLLRVIEPGRPVGPVIRVFFVSTFAGAFLPGSIGGDALRAFGIARAGVSTANAMASVTADRLIGTVSVFLMGAIGVGLLGRLADPRLLAAAVAAVVVAGVVTVGLLFSARPFRWVVSRTAGRWPRAERAAQQFLGALGQYGSHASALWAVLAMSVAVQVLRTLQAWCLGLALGLTIGGAWYFAIIPVILLIVLLPISVGGFGTGNAAFVTLFALAGVHSDQAFILSVMFLSLGIFGNLPGGVLFATGASFTPPASRTEV